MKEKKWKFYIVATIIIFFILCFLCYCNNNLLFIIWKIITFLFILTILSTCVYFLYVRYMEVRKIEKLRRDKYNKIKDYDYYRDTIHEAPVAVLAYCMNRHYDFNKVFIASILDLERRKYIQINEDQIIIINKEWNTLSSNEKYILDGIAKNNIKKIYNTSENRKRWKEIVISDSKKMKLYSRINNYLKYRDLYFKYFFVFWIIMLFLGVLSAFSAPVMDDENIKNYTIFFYFLPFIAAGFYKIYEILLFESNVRSNKAIEISAKLESLKKYIKEFSNIENKSIEEIKMWDEYMIYAIMLDIDGDINKSLKEFSNKYLVINDKNNNL